METGNGTAGYGGEEDGEEVLGTVSIVHSKAGVGREKIGVNIRMGSYDAYYRHDEHGVEQEGGEVVPGLQENPHGSDGGDGNVKADEPHPGVGGEIEGVEIHADGHAEHNGCYAKDGGSHHAGVAAVYRKAEYNGHGNEEEGHHGHGSLGGALRFIQHAIFIDRTEGGSHDGRKGRHHQDECEVGENNKELLRPFGHIGGNDFADGLAIVAHRREKGAEVMDAAEEDAAHQHPQGHRKPAEHGGANGARNGACAGDG